MAHEPTKTTNTALLARAETRLFDEKERRAFLGQFLTPTPIADLMVSLFRANFREINLLDAGAGTGALTAALVHRFCNARQKPKSISVTAYELDATLIPQLRATLDKCKNQCDLARISFSATVINEDFIASVVPVVREELFAPRLPQFNMAITNPRIARFEVTHPLDICCV